MKQAANNWYKELANFLLRQGFTRSRNDHCLVARSEAEDHTFIFVWVDDIIVASRSMTVVSDVKKALEATFHMEDRGRLHWFLVLRIRREEGKVTVDQERYIETKLERFQMDQCKPSRTPADLNLKLQTAQNGGEEVDQKIYRSLVGSLLYLAKQTRPEIMFTVNILSRHMNSHTNQHRMCGKQLLEDSGIQQKRPIAIGEDNQSCIRLCQNPVMHKRSKHIETKFHFIRYKTEDGTILIHCVPTDKMAADIFTKSLPVS